MKFNFDRDFFYKVWSRYSELDGQKPFRIICEKLHFFQNYHSFIKNFIFGSNLNFIINDNKNFFLPDSMVTQFLDLQMGLNTLSFMPISPKFGIIVVNSVWSYKFTNNFWTGLEEKFYTSIERQTDLFKFLYIDNSSILINNQQFKESELIWQPKNDEFAIALGIDSTKDLAVLLKNNINLIVYKCLLNLEVEFFYLNEFGSAYSNNFLILPKKL